MKKFLVLAGMIVIAVLALSGCRSIFGRGHGPVDSFAFLPENNPGLSRPVMGSIVESGDPKRIELVVPPGTDMTHLVATISLNTEATITVVSSGAGIRQDNGVTANNFQAPVLYSIMVPKDKDPWNYRVSVREADTNPRLSALGVSESTVSPSFNPTVFSYSTTVPFAANQIQVEARAQSAHLRDIIIDGTMSRGTSAKTDVQFTATNRKQIIIETTAEDGVTKAQYTLTIVRGEPDRNSALQSLSVDGTTISPYFRPDQLTYVAQVPYAAQYVDISAIAQSRFSQVTAGIPAGMQTGSSAAGTTNGGGAVAPAPANTSPPVSTISVDGTLNSSRGGRVAFTNRSQFSVPIVVTAQDGSSTIYRLDIVRAAPDSNNALAQLSSPDAEITPQFDPGRLTYTANIPYTATRLVLATRPQSSVAGVDMGTIPGPNLPSSIKYTGNPDSSAGASVDVRNIDRATLSVLVTAQDGSQRRYVIHVRRMPPDSNSDLAEITVSPGILMPSFSPRNVAYSVTIPGTAPAARIDVKTASRYATVGTTDGSIVMSGNGSSRTLTVPVAGGQSRSIDLVVTAQDGSQRLYKVTVSREQPPVVKDNNSSLSAIVLDGGTLQPQFSPNRFSYRVTLPVNQARVSVYPIAASRSARVLIDGQQIGNQPRIIQIQPGYTQVVAVQVVAETGATTRYTVQITRERPAPSQAPPTQSQQPQQPPQEQPPATQPPVTSVPTPVNIPVVIHVHSDSVRLDRAVYNELKSAGDSAGNQAVISVRPYRGNEVLAQDTRSVQIKQAGNSPTVLSTEWESKPIRISTGRLIEVEISIRTQKGKYLYYAQALPVSREINLDIPFYRYSSSAVVTWPGVGTPVPVAGVISAVPGGFFDISNREKKQDRPAEDNRPGEIRLSVRGQNGKEQVLNLSWNKRSDYRQADFKGSDHVTLPEGSEVSYTLDIKGKSGRNWRVVHGAQVWTTQLSEAGGFAPASIVIFDELK